jgi:hypothetical protein
MAEAFGHGGLQRQQGQYHCHQPSSQARQEQQSPASSPIGGYMGPNLAITLLRKNYPILLHFFPITMGVDVRYGRLILMLNLGFAVPISFMPTGLSAAVRSMKELADQQATLLNQQAASLNYQAANLLSLAAADSETDDTGNVAWMEEEAASLNQQADSLNQQAAELSGRPVSPNAIAQIVGQYFARPFSFKEVSAAATANPNESRHLIQLLQWSADYAHDGDGPETQNYGVAPDFACGFNFDLPAWTGVPADWYFGLV